MDVIVGKTMGLSYRNKLQGSWWCECYVQLVRNAARVRFKATIPGIFLNMCVKWNWSWERDWNWSNILDSYCSTMCIFTRDYIVDKIVQFHGIIYAPLFIGSRKNTLLRLKLRSEFIKTSPAWALDLIVPTYFQDCIIQRRPHTHTG